MNPVLQNHSPKTANDYFNQGNQLKQSEQYQDAVEAYEKAIGLNPHFSWYYHNLAEVFIELEDWEKAISSFRQACEINPNSEWSFYQLGEGLVQQGELEEAIAAFQTAIELNPGYAEFYSSLGDILWQAEQLEEAEKTLQKAVEIDPESVNAYQNLWEVLAKQEKGDEGLVYLQKAVELNPVSWELNQKLGEVLHGKRDLEAAEKCYRTVIKLNSDYHWGYYKLGVILREQGKVEEAIASLQKAVELEPSSAICHHYLGHSLAVLQRWDEAIDCYRKAIELSPESAIIYQHLGDALSQLGQWNEAVVEYRKGVKLDPNSLEGQHHLGLALAQMEEWEEAIACYRKIHQISPQKGDLFFNEIIGERLKYFQDQLKTDLTEHSQLEGYLDQVEVTHISGWARDHKNPNNIVMIDVFIGNNLIGTYMASQVRQDLVKKFCNHGKYGFYIKLPPGLTSQDFVNISVKFNKNGQHLEKSPLSILLRPRGVMHRIQEKTSLNFKPKIHDLLYQIPENLQTHKPLIAIIILNLNGAELLSILFESFKKYNTYQKIEFIIVDHKSVDKSVEICKNWSNQLDIKIIERDKNYSFSSSNNLAVSQTEAPLILFLNNDISFCQDILSSLVQLMADESLGIIGLKLLDVIPADNYLAQPPTLHLGVQFDFYQSDRLIYPFDMSYSPQFLGICNAPWQVPSVTGAAMICRREEFLAVGGFHEDYFYGYEDVDFCLKFQQTMGKKVICANHLTAIHNKGFTRFKGGQAFDQRIANNRHIIENRFGYFVRRNHLQGFFDKSLFWTSNSLRIGFAVTDTNINAAAGDYFTALELGEELVIEFGWDVFYLSSKDQEWFDMTLLDVLVVMRDDYPLHMIQNTKPSLVKVAWARNWFDRWVSREWVGDYDCFWCSSDQAASYISRELSKPATVLRIATNQERFSNGVFKPELKSDYCFTGSYWGAEREIIDFLEPNNLSFDFALYGHNWASFSKFQKFYRGSLPYTELPDVYASTKIVIDDANLVTKPWGSVNSRVFDAIAAGALVITNGQIGNEEVFDGLLPTYNSKESLEKILKQYLTNEPLRQQKVTQLRQVIQEKHTYKHRAYIVFSTLQEKMSQTYRIAIKIGVPDWHQANEWGDYHFAKAMKRAFERQGHSVRIDILPEWDTPKTLGDDVTIVIRGLSCYQPKGYHINLMWNISHPDKVSLEEYEQYDQVFVASYSYAEQLQTKLKVPVEPLLQCTDPQVFYPDNTGDDEVGDILFVGNSRKVYRKIVKDAVSTGLKVDVYGKNWESFIPEGYLKGEYIPNEVLRKYYTKCGVLLNDHWDTMRAKGFISNRLFDATACGATIISDSIAGLDKIFGDKVLIYKDTMELRNLVFQVLQKKDSNVKEQTKCLDFIKANHTFEKRVSKILSAVQKINSEKMHQAI